MMNQDNIVIISDLSRNYVHLENGIPTINYIDLYRLPFDYIVNIDFSDLLTLSPPIPLKYNGEFITYSGQGTFRTGDGTSYVPVADFMKLLNGSIRNDQGEIILTYKNYETVLQKEKAILWKNRYYYPLIEFKEAFNLKAQSITNFFVNELRDIDKIPAYEIIEISDREETPVK
ncbi:hypothetical protein ACFPXP_10625 [Marinicrinis lubricantis]|uniref:Uncharacterized protein n=2 Tax=Marinicrinis lubricantis TaxID=2086470 RepID=A0ABW1IP77_9BACL